MDLAFRWARKAGGKKVKLFYNDYFVTEMMAGAEYLTGGQFDDGDPVPFALPGANGPIPCDAQVKCAAVKRLVSGMVRRGVPIDGVGFQGHIPSAVAPDYAAMTDWVGELGLEWAVTEMDVPVPNGSGPYGGWGHQASTYSAVAEACIRDPACSTLVTWGISDRYTWWSDLVGGFLGDALHFTAGLEPKPAADALHEVFASAAG
jgi:endo-1,4-beta-xylanase